MKISVITVCRNAEETIEETVRSVLSQTYKNIEYIIIDGKSTDRTIAVLNKYKDKIDTLISESDRGIYDAMNKAINLCSGEWLFFLNAGDTFINNEIITKVSTEIFNLKKENILYGNVLTNREGDQIINKYDHIDRWFLIRNTICHQATFTKKALYIKFGSFDIKYKIAADYEWLLRMILKNKVTHKYINVEISNYSLDGISNDKAHRNAVLAEYSDIRKIYFSKFEIVVYELYSFILGVLVRIKKLFF